MTLFFTKRKFLSYSKESQHKKAAECVKDVYLELLYQKGSLQTKQENYEKLSLWMELEQVELTLEKLSSRYHFHIEHASSHLKEHEFLPKVEHLDKALAEEFLPIDIYLHHIRSSFNIGSIMRTTEAMRLGSLYFSKEMASPTNKKVLDASMGSEKFQTPKLLEDPSQLKGPIIAVETTEDATCIHEFTFPKSFTLVLGNEEFGVSQSWLQQADHIVKIPLQGIKNSLNVASAFSIIAYEIRRQLSL